MNQHSSTTIVWISLLLCFLMGHLSATKDHVAPFILTDDEDADVQKKQAGSESLIDESVAKSLINACESKSSGGNVAISVFNIFTIFTMLQTGTAGNSLSELNKLFHFDLVKRAHLTGLLKRIHTIVGKVSADSELLSSNALYSDSGVKSEYVREIKEKYYVTAKEVSFTNPAAVVKEINKQVSDDTHGKIATLLESNAITTDTRIVLVSALYFKSAWAKAFSKTSTVPLPFYVTPTSAENIPKMNGPIPSVRHIQGDVGYLALPFKNKKFCFVVEMTMGTSKVLVKEMNMQVIKDVAKKTQGTLTTVDVSMPKFTIDFSVDLIPVLKSLGLHSIFKPSTDFEKIYTSTAPMQVSSAIHKVVVDVNEEGAEAIAASSLQLRSRSLAVRPKFDIDHPFRFYIVAVVEEEILFSGSVMKPEVKK